MEAPIYATGIAAKLRSQRDREEGLGQNHMALKFYGQDYESLKARSVQTRILFEDPLFPCAASSLGFNELGPRSAKTSGVRWMRPKVWRGRGLAMNRVRQNTCVSFDALVLRFPCMDSVSLRCVLIPQFTPHHPPDLCWDPAGPSGTQRDPAGPSGTQRDPAGPNGTQRDPAGPNGTQRDPTGPSGTQRDPTGPSGTQRDPIPMQPSTLELGISNAKDQEAVTFKKLVKGHAYSVTGVDEVVYRGTLTKLVRIRNPWGEVEWTGAWSDNSREWDNVDRSVRSRLQNRSEDGEFWMSFSDFLREFSRLEICNLTPDTLQNSQLKKWSTSLYQGEWRRGSTAGGCRNFPATFWINPQFKVALEHPDSAGNSDCSFLVALMQKDRRKKRREGKDMETIGFAIYEVPHEFVGKSAVHLKRDYFLNHSSTARSELFINLREVSSRFSLPAGEYIIVPSTFEPQKEGDFVLRVFSEKPTNSEELDDDVTADLPPETQLNESQIDQAFKNLFRQLAGPDMEISVTELQTILNRIISKHKDLKTDGFSQEACRSMINLMDTDGSGKLGLSEFHVLWEKIKRYLTVFRQFDMDKSGTMNSYEMRRALDSAGFKLTNHLFQLIILRYTEDDLSVDFDNFVTCLVRLETMFKTFRTMDTDRDDVISLNFFQWISLTMFA
ncbi:unnamed protein product [Merluccius merluccius]